jgi:hypothetical protein
MPLQSCRLCLYKVIVYASDVLFMQYTVQVPTVKLFLLYFYCLTVPGRYLLRLGYSQNVPVSSCVLACIKIKRNVLRYKANALECINSDFF